MTNASTLKELLSTPDIRDGRSDSLSACSEEEARRADQTSRVTSAPGKEPVPHFRASTRVSTTFMDPKIRNDIWRETVRPIFDVVPERAGALLEGSIATSELGSLIIGATTFNSQRYKRDRRLVLSSGLDQYKVQLYLSGTAIGYCDDRLFRLEPGDVSVFDMARSIHSQVYSGSTITVVLPRTPVDKAAGGKIVHGTVLRANEPMTRILSGVLITLADLAGTMEREEELILEESATALLATALVGRTPRDGSERPAMMHMLRRQMLDYIDAHLSEPGLGPELLMRQFLISRAHLYRVFAADGGVTKIIRDKRLDACYRELVNPHLYIRRSITEIAHHFSFSSSSQFLRAFRARFETTPSEVREHGFSFVLADRKAWTLQSHFAGFINQVTPHDRMA